MKKFLIGTVVILIVAILAGCAPQQTPAQEAPAVNYPTRPITMIVSFSAGGGTDVGARLLVPFLEAELGQPVNVVNITGAGGWVGWTRLSQAEPDGYTIGFVNLPSLITGYLNPEMGRPAALGMFTPLANQVLDSSVWAVRPDFHLQSVEEILEYARNNPGKLSITTTGLFTQHHINTVVLEREGYTFNVVHTEGAADAAAMALGGHVDILSTGVGEIGALADEGKLNVLAVLDDERSVHLPEVPTFLEAGGMELISFSTRGVMAPAGVPEEIIDRLATAFENAINNPEHIKSLEELGLAVRFMGPAEFETFLLEYEAELKEVMGW